MQSSAALPNSVGLTAYYTHSQNGQCANCSATLLDFHLNVVLLPCQTQLYTTIVLKCLESILKFIEPFCFYFFVLFLIRQRLLKLSRYRGAKVVLSYGRASLAERKQRRLKRTCKISPCPMYAGCLRHRNSDIRDEQKFFCVQLYLGTNKKQPFESNTFQRGLSGHQEMSPAGNISGSMLLLFTSILKKSLIDFLFLWSIISHGNLKADPLHKNDDMTNKPSTLQMSRACCAN